MLVEAGLTDEAEVRRVLGTPGVEAGLSPLEAPAGADGAGPADAKEGTR